MTDDERITKLEAAVSSAVGAMRLAMEAQRKAEALAAERLEGLLAAAAFATVLAKQLKLDDAG